MAIDYSIAKMFTTKFILIRNDYVKTSCPTIVD